MQTEPESPSLRALAIDEPISVDGLLDEAVWTRAQPATGFIQREPRPGDPATEETIVRVLYSRDTLYIGVHAGSSDPEAISATEMQRDGSGTRGGNRRNTRLEADDSLVVLLDTFHDHRNAFLFETNPNAARSDALVTDEGRDRNFEWDGVWSVAARRIPEGWSVEFAIPFSTLRFNANLDTWGFNVRRIIRGKNENVYWSPVSLDSNIYRISRAGHLTGLDDLRKRINLRVKPFVLGGRTVSFEASERDVSDKVEGGVDVRWGMTQSLTLDLTYKTDFAQVEVDEQQVNLTRFSLFFPEKREFFLENAGVFEFGPRSATGLNRPPLLKAFFSRRIGLDPDGNQVPITGGAKLTGRAGGWTLGLMDVQTERTFVDDAEAPIRETNWGVLRVKRSLGQRSSLGMIFTNRQSDGDNYNRVFGVDTDLNPTRQLNLNAFFLTSRDAGLESDGWAAGGGFAWRGRIWEGTLDFVEISDDFDPGMGFLLRKGIRQLRSNVTARPRPRIPGIRHVEFNARSDITTRSDGTLETAQTTARFLGVRFLSDDFITFFTRFNSERLFEPFEIRPDVFIPVDRYDFVDHGLFFRTNRSRLLSARGLVFFGDFFHGKRFGHNLTMDFRPSNHFTTSTTWILNDVELPTASFVTNVLRQRIDVSLNPNLFANALMQLNDGDELASLNLRLNWIYRPGADLFLVYTETWETDQPSWTTRDRALMLKFTYLFIL